MEEFFNDNLGIMGFADSEPIPLRWGEVIPLWFFKEFINMTQKKLIVFTLPYRRIDHGAEMIPELLGIGGALYEYFQSIPERVMMVISSDLAHTHSSDGPYGYNNASAPFDNACGRWAQHLDRNALLVDAANLLNKALSCGFTGLVVQQGVLDRAKIKGKPWVSNLLANYHPTYYGMMVVKFYPK